MISRLGSCPDTRRSSLVVDLDAPFLGYGAAREPPQLRDRDPRQPPLRLVGRGRAGCALPARAGRAALELRHLDRAFALQPPDGAAAAHEPSGGVRIGVLQTGLPALLGAPRRARDGVQEAPALDLPADLSEALARVPHARARLDAGAEQAHRHQPRL